MTSSITFDGEQEAMARTTTPTPTPVIQEEDITVSVEQVLEVLNRAVQADRKAMSYLLEYRIEVNETLADDPTIQVVAHKEVVSRGVLGVEKTYSMLGALGLINGLLGIREDGWGHITMIVDEETGLIEEFIRTRRNPMEKAED